MAGIPGVQNPNLLAVVLQLHFKRGMGQCNRRERFRNMLEFNGVVLQELTTRRDIEEKVFRRDAGSNGARRFFSLAQLAAVAAEFGGDVVLNRSALDGCVGNGRNGGQSLAPKAHRLQRKEVVGGLKFGRGVPRKGRSEVLGVHAASVVDDLDGRSARVLNEHRHLRSPRIQGVLHQFLHNRCRALDDLAGGNLIGDLLGEVVNDGHGLKECEGWPGNAA